MDNKTPLVTVSVLVYNSSRYLIEALESVKNQTYRNIELVISDDCSTDNSVKMSQEWLEKNKERFVRSEILTIEKNTGVTANSNRALAWARGEWNCGIGADDALLPNAINDYVDYMNTHPDCKVVIGARVYIDEDSNVITTQKDSLDIPFFYRESFSVKKQAWLMTKKILPHLNGLFISVDAIRRVGGFDERFRNIEDIPLYIRLTQAGYHFDWLGKYTKKYRIDSNSISHSKEKEDSIISKLNTQNVMDYKYKYCTEYLGTFWRFFMNYDMMFKRLIINHGNTKNSLVCRLAYFINRLTNPLTLVEYYLHYSKF